MQERVKRINNTCAKDKNCFVVSVHANAGKGTGVEVWTSIGRTKSDDIATVFWQEMISGILHGFKKKVMT